MRINFCGLNLVLYIFLGGGSFTLLTVLNYNLDSKVNSFLFNSIQNCKTNLRHLPCLRNRIFCLIIEKDNYVKMHVAHRKGSLVIKHVNIYTCHGNLVPTFMYQILTFSSPFFFFKLEDFLPPQRLAYRFPLTRQMFAYFRFIILRK